MRIETKLYLYDSSQESNDYKGEDLSMYVLQGDSYTEDITEELDVAELTLAGLPRKREFDPETKFILQKISVKEIEIEGEKFLEETPFATYHLVVDQDTVEQPILSDDNYFNHHISFIEPSVVAQKRLVDNISVTYKLQNVNLETQPAFDRNQVSKTINTPSVYTPVFYGNEANDKMFGNFRTGFLGWYDNSIWGKYFVLDGQIKMVSRAGGSGSNNLYQNISDYAENGIYYASFLLPKMKIYFGQKDTTSFTYIGDASLHYIIQEFDLNDYYTPTGTWEGDVISNSNLNLNNVSSYPLKLDEQNISSQYSRAEYLVENFDQYTTGSPTGGTDTNNNVYVRRYTDTTIATPQYKTIEVPIQNNKKYIINISLKEFSDNFELSIPGGPSKGRLKTTTETPTRFCQATVSGTSYKKEKIESLNQNQITSSCTFQTYSTDEVRILLKSANPYNALTLLQKAIVNSHFVEKQPNIFIGDTNNMNLPFVIAEDWVEQLEETQVIEMFYNQKNLWEVLLEVGKYIHAVPKIEFGANDKFVISFDKLGSIKEETKEGTKTSVMNFKKVSDYVSACSSYVANMVQLGGQIEEWVAPKTNGETPLVYNDTCSINVSKPIIELLDVKVKCVSGNYDFASVGQDADMTQYTYEESVYNLLSVAYTDKPNKGISIYYKLGTNKLVGCDFKNPTASSGSKQNDYAIKKIIFLAFNGFPADWGSPTENAGWNEIKVNDFIFKVTYRTKDNVRQNQTRPDLRKYLLNSKHDRVPQHNQFNNQTDVLVDSVKWGNNVAGKLIRTGNSNYKIIEWNEDPENLKHKGELYRINEELYYVAKVKHTYFSSYILSEIDYSKDYNQLSPVIGIPSEPRFYEISERSIVDRDVAISDYLLLTTDTNKIDTENTMLKRIDHLSEVMFGGESSDFAKYVVTTFKGDIDTPATDIEQGSNNNYIDILSPLNAYSSQNTLTYEWDMVDNFSAGDKVGELDYTGDVTVANNSYKPLKAVQYTDIFGKVSLFDFYLLEDIPTLAPEEVQNMPESPYRTKSVVTNQQDPDYNKTFIGTIQDKILATNVKDLTDTNYNGRGIGLLKDCRETIKLNYNEEIITDSDTFVLTPNIFVQNKQGVKVVLLKNEVNKLNSGFIDNSSIIIPYDTNGQQMSKYFDIDKIVSPNEPMFEIPLSTIFANVNVNHFGEREEEQGFEKVKAIAIVYDIIEGEGQEGGGVYIPNKTRLVVAKNIPDLEGYREKENALKNWYVAPPNKNIFTNKQ